MRIFRVLDPEVVYNDVCVGADGPYSFHVFHYLVHFFVVVLPHVVMSYQVNQLTQARVYDPRTIRARLIKIGKR